MLKRYPDRATYEVDMGGASYFVKIYRPCSLVGRWRDFVLRRRPQRANALAGELLAEGVGTPPSLGLFGVGKLPLREAILVNQWVPGCLKWSLHLQQRVMKAEDPEVFRREVRDLGRLLGSLHRMGLYHGDLVANLFVGRVQSAFKPLLVDLEALQRRRAGHRKRKNLGELARAAQHIPGLSARDRHSFLAAYTEASGDGGAVMPNLWRELRAAQDRYIERRNHLTK